MKTVADFKRRIAVGVKLHTTNHLAFAGRDENMKVLYKDEDRGIREVSIVQSTQFALKTEKHDGTFYDSWCTFPKASECRVFGDFITFLDFHTANGISIAYPCQTYKFV